MNLARAAATLDSCQTNCNGALDNYFSQATAEEAAIDEPLSNIKNKPASQFATTAVTLADRKNRKILAIKYVTIPDSDDPSAKSEALDLTAYGLQTCQPTADKPNLISKFLIFASDPYSLAFQGGCATGSNAVPNDPIYQNSGVSLSYSYNPLAQSVTPAKDGKSATEQINGAGSGKLVGAAGVNFDTKWVSIAPFIGIDYEYNLKSVGPGHIDVTQSPSVKNVYYGLTLNRNFKIFPTLTCDEGTGTSKIYALTQANDVGGEFSTLYSPLNQSRANTVATDINTVGFLSRLHPAAANEDDLCFKGDKDLNGYYVWKQTKLGVSTDVNVTLDSFFLKDQIYGSKIWVTSARLVPFANFQFPLLGVLGLNQFNRPPPYLSGYATDTLLGGLAEPNCSNSDVICGFGDTKNPLNVLDFLPLHTRVALVGDLRLDTGDFLTRGVPPPGDPNLDKNYVRIGGRTGIILELNLIRNNPIALQATYLDYAPLSGFSKSLGLAQYEVDYSLPNLKNVIFSFSYDNGRQQDTGIRIESLSFGLALKD